jgi:hypothetical protein
MRGRIAAAADGGDERPVIPWRLVIGALLHFIVPAYLATIVIAGLLDGPHPVSAEAMLDFIVGVSGKFVGFYLLLILFAALVARLLDPSLRKRRARREATDPALAARRSQRRFAQATAQAAGLAFGGAAGRITAAVAAIRGDRWDHGDDRFQALSADLAEATQAFAKAFEMADAERRAEIATLAATSLERIAAALAALSAERSRLDEGDARTVARYIDARYGPSDFAGDAD